ncbi:MAG TPA: hypothetical protein VHS06_09105, partial [Chloroflexota bacterium]|nr:hypothetical protein [Chloroflexota bacterium]
MGRTCSRALAAALALALAGFATACTPPPPPPATVQSVPIAVTLPPVAQSAPRSWIDAPLHGSSIALGPVQVVSHSTHPGGVSEVELSVDGNIVDSEVSPNPKKALVTVRQDWVPKESGKRVIRLRARNGTGDWGAYATAEVTIMAGPTEIPIVPSPQPTAGPTLSGTATPTAT